MPIDLPGDQRQSNRSEGRSRTAHERRESARQTYEQFAPGADPDRILASLERRMGALGTFVFDVVGDVWSRPLLSRRDRSLAVISVLSARTRGDELQAHTRIGLRHGLTHAEITEVLLHVATCVGFPAALASSRHIEQAFREESGDNVPPNKSAVVKDDHRRGVDAEAIAVRLGQATEDSTGSGLRELVDRWSLGEVWSRTELSLRDRCLVTIAILAATAEDDQLEVFVQAGLKSGLTAAEVEELLTHLGLYFGLPRSMSAMATAQRAFQRWR